MAGPLASIGIGAGMSLLGGLLGGSQNPTIDPAILRQLFGPQQIAKDTTALNKLLMSSPAFAQMMNQAAMQGARMSNNAAAGLARAGLSGSGIGAVQTAMNTGLTGSMQGRARADLFLQALQAAVNNNQNMMNLYGQSQIQRQGQPTFSRMIGSSLLSGGSQGLLGGLQNLFSPGSSGSGFNIPNWAMNVAQNPIRIP